MISGLSPQASVGIAYNAGVDGSEQSPNAGAKQQPDVSETASKTAGPSRRPGAEKEIQGLSHAEKAMIRELEARDQEVRAHEQAHQIAGAGHIIQGAQYSYQKGPDGVRYAVGGEVRIDTSPVPGDPEATIEKAEQIRKAALAPARPSTQDRQVAARAMQMKTAAQSEKLQEIAAESEKSRQADENISHRQRVDLFV